MDILNRLERDYADFGDALIVNVEYFSGYNFKNRSIQSEEVTITISCFNINKPYDESRELVSLKCSDISYLSLKKYNGMIYQALLIKIENVYVLDFFPDLVAAENGNGVVGHENPDSICIIKCKEIEFKVISEDKASC